MNRKPPGRHRVSSYNKRDGTKVDSYMRGDGALSTSISTKKRVTNIKTIDDDGGGGEWEYFTVFLFYKNEDYEVLPIMAVDADDALNLALMQRAMKDKKVEFSLVRDGLGDVARRLVKATNHRIQAGVLGVQGERERIRDYEKRVKRKVRDIKRAPRKFYESLIDEKEAGEVEALIKAGQDTGRRFKAQVARRRLKAKYPRIYKSVAWVKI